MATAKVEQKETKKMKMVEVIEYTNETVLRLSEDEASFLQDILYRIGGSPLNSRRKHADSIINALNKAGVCITPADDYDMTRANSIYFV